MVRFYCPVCWKDSAEDLPQCPHCGAEIHDIWGSKSFLEKLLLALNHPEPSTVMRAVWLLGQLGDRRAVEPLERLLESTRDVFVTRAAKVALSALEAPDAGRGRS
jgi:HEAT repeat protein